MKKQTAARMAMLLAAALLVGTLGACGKKGEEDQESQSGQGTGAQEIERIVLKDLDVDKYVTLGDYQSIRVPYAITVDEKEVDDLFTEVYNNSFPEELGVKDRPVEMGDATNLDYVGKKDGEAFAGGTAQGAILTIGSHSYIDGFEDGLIGVSPGETVDLNLTFPENYDNTDLAGQAVVFTVTVNFIIPAEKMEEAVKYFGVEEVTTLAELRQYIYDYIYEYEEEQLLGSFQNDVIKEFMDSCEFHEIPQSMFDSFRAITKQNIASVAADYGMDADSYINYFYQTDLNSFVEFYADDALRQNIAMQAVANREGLGMDDEELEKQLKLYTENSGASSVEEFLGDTTKEEFREYFMYENVLNYLTENAKK